MSVLALTAVVFLTSSCMEDEVIEPQTEIENPTFDPDEEPETDPPCLGC